MTTAQRLAADIAEDSTMHTTVEVVVVHQDHSTTRYDIVNTHHDPDRNVIELVVCDTPA